MEKKKEKKAISSRDKDVCIPLEAACKPDSLAYQFATVTDNQLTKFRILIWSRILYEGNVDIRGRGKLPHLGADLLLAVSWRTRKYLLNLMRELKKSIMNFRYDPKVLKNFWIFFFFFVNQTEETQRC